MSALLTVLLIESSSDDCEALIKCAESNKDIHIVSISNNSDEALKYLIDNSPDAVILDLELINGIGDGISFLTKLRECITNALPYILVTTDNVSKTTHKKARLLGADFIMIKSHTDYNAKKVIDFLSSLRIVIHNTREIELANTLNVTKLSVSDSYSDTTALVSAELNVLGVSHKHIGRDYLLEAIILVISEHRFFIPVIAKKHKKSDASVERAMQNAIVNLWRTADEETLLVNYTAHISSQKGMPTLNEFVFFVADKVKQLQ